LSDAAVARATPGMSPTTKLRNRAAIIHTLSRQGSLGGISVLPHSSSSLGLGSLGHDSTGSPITPSMTAPVHSSHNLLASKFEAMGASVRAPHPPHHVPHTSPIHRHSASGAHPVALRRERSGSASSSRDRALQEPLLQGEDELSVRERGGPAAIPEMHHAAREH
jgi:hypothetical protein